MARRVIKFGGSLLTAPGIDALWKSWIATQPPAQNVIVAGAGALADAIRRIDDTHRLEEELTHWLCVDVLSLSARLTKRLLPDTTLVTRWDELTERVVVNTRPCQIVFDPSDFLRKAEPTLPGEKLPIGWMVTSDSIAARVAQALEADELVLLKSAPVPVPPSRRQAAKIGLVDTHFPIASDPIATVRVVNLRSADRESKLLVKA